MTKLRQGDLEGGLTDWRVVGDSVSAWFEAPSHNAGAALITRITELTDGNELPDLDLRATGLRVRLHPAGLTSAGVSSASLDPAGLAHAISAAALKLGLTADPSVLQTLEFAVDAAGLAEVTSFWQTVLAYQPSDDSFGDPLRRDPAVSFHQLQDPRPLRNRIHVDVVRSPEAVAAVKSTFGLEAYGAYGLTLADAEGNEVDLVPGATLTESPDTADWRTVFGAMAFYPTASPTQASALATAVATLADAADIPLLVDLRPAGVTIDSGKDQWENDEARFSRLAAEIQAAARALEPHR